MFESKDRSLEGKKGLVLGIANRDSIAYGCAKAFKSLGAELALTYLNDKAKPYVEPIAEELGAEIFMPCDVQDDTQLQGLFAAIRGK
jgi:enoyl-[acyl-carrier protein] reductase I